MDKFRTDQSSALTFLQDMNLDKEKLNLRSARELFEEYKDYCRECGYLQMNRRNFQNEVCEEYKMHMACTTKDGVNQQWRFKA